MEDLKQKVEEAVAPLEAKVDSVWTKIGEWKWTWAVTIALALAIIVL